mgnify:CR=1 FL=1
MTNRLFFPALALLAASAQATLLVEERFAYGDGTNLLGTAPNALGVASYEYGGWGWQGAVGGGNFADPLGGADSTKDYYTTGGALRINLSSAVPATDGTTLHGSFNAVCWSNPTYGWLEFGNLRIGRNGGSTDWSIQDKTGGAAVLTGDPSWNGTFLQFSIDFLPGNDVVKLWVSPNVSGPLGVPDAVLSNRDLVGFSSILFGCDNGTSVDNIRLGTAPESVGAVPEPASVAVLGLALAAFRRRRA